MDKTQVQTDSNKEAQKEQEAAALAAAQSAPPPNHIFPWENCEPTDSAIPLPDGIRKKKQSPKERATSWAAFIRSLEPAKQRAARSDKCPCEILQRLLGAHEKEFYYQIFWSCHASWKKVQAWDRLYTVELESKRMNWRWATEGQLVKHYQCPLTVASLVKLKSSNPLTHRLHPEIPHEPLAKQYYCWWGEESLQSIDRILERGLSLKCELDGDSAATQMFFDQAAHHMAKSSHSMKPANDFSYAHTPRSAPLSPPAPCQEAWGAPPSTVPRTPSSHARTSQTGNQRPELKTALAEHSPETKKKILIADKVLEKEREKEAKQSANKRKREEEQASAKRKKERIQATPKFKAGKFSTKAETLRTDIETIVQDIKGKESCVPQDLKIVWTNKHETNYSKVLQEEIGRLDDILNAEEDPTGHQSTNALSRIDTAWRVADALKVDKRLFDNNCKSWSKQKTTATAATAAATAAK